MFRQTGRIFRIQFGLYSRVRGRVGGKRKETRSLKTRIAPWVGHCVVGGEVENVRNNNRAV